MTTPLFTPFFRMPMGTESRRALAVAVSGLLHPIDHEIQCARFRGREGLASDLEALRTQLHDVAVAELKRLEDEEGKRP